MDWQRSSPILQMTCSPLDVPANDSISNKKIGVADCQNINVVNIQVDFCVLFEHVLAFEFARDR